MSTPTLHVLAGPDAQLEHAYDASAAAEAQRQRLMRDGAWFITETVFSHPSKVALVRQAVALGYLVHLHVVLVPVDLSVHRVAERVRRGGYDVPEVKTRQRYDRLWPLITTARDTADRADFYDNSRAASPFRLVAAYDRGRPVEDTSWPARTEAPLID
ncbi:MAG: zeta toxin family protein [Ornithinimicrobium sp.]|uniref:zeta toxin family protein n=1 Tax=Ornithinimicrobium sp. TaxID=1977084 RepID=UPI003D9AD747